MKKFRMFMFTAAVALTAAPFLNSCESDSNSLPTENSGVAGTYKMTAFNIPTAVDYNLDDVTSTNLLSESDCFVDNFIRLNNNSTYARTNNYIDLSSGLPACAQYVETGTWVKDDNLVITSSSDTNGFLSADTEFMYDGSNVLTISMTGANYPGVDDMGAPTTLQGDINYVFTRVAE